MKRPLVILLTFFYLLAASGVAISFHYCGHKLQEISFFKVNDEEGCCGKKMKEKGCCHEKTAFLKAADKHGNNLDLNFSFNKTVKQFSATIPVPIALTIVLAADFNTSNYHAPPLLYDTPIYLKNRTLII
jgi:hypothetical protein